MNSFRFKTVFSLFTLLLFIACQPAKKKENDVVSGGGATTGGTSSGGGGGTTTTATYGIIFVSTTGFNGGGGDISSGSPAPASGISMFDNVCASNATAKGLTGTFKALVTDGSTRMACTTSNCSGGASERVDWPLATRMEYRREDGTTVIGKTDPKGLLKFPLTNAISASAETVWTGIGSGWVADQHCDGWTRDNINWYGRTGLANSTSSSAINSGTTTNCLTQNLKFLCVQVKTDVAAATQASYRKIFATSSTYNMNAPVASDGLARLDGFCKSEAEALGYNMDDDSFKALVMTNGNNTYTKRIGCNTAYCSTGTGEHVNWALDSNREYRRQNGTTVIGTTNAEGIFDMPLTNSVTGVNESYWTGFPESWGILTAGANSDCGAWTDNSVGGRMYFGKGNVTDATSFSDTSNLGYCNSSLKLLCVEQTR